MSWEFMETCGGSTMESRGFTSNEGFPISGISNIIFFLKISKSKDTYRAVSGQYPTGYTRFLKYPRNVD